MHYQKELPRYFDNVTKGMLEMIGFQFGEDKGKYIEANLPNGWSIICPWNHEYTSELLYGAGNNYFVDHCNLIGENGYVRALLTSNSKEVKMRFYPRYYIDKKVNGPLVEDWDKQEYTVAFKFIDGQEKKALYTKTETFKATKASYDNDKARIYLKLEKEMLEIIQKDFHNYENPLVYWGKKQ